MHQVQYRNHLIKDRCKFFSDVGKITTTNKNNNNNQIIEKGPRIAQWYKHPLMGSRSTVELHQ